MAFGPAIVSDHEGGQWVVKEARRTQHDWDMLLGRPVNDLRGANMVIITAELADYLRSRHYPQRRVDLPLSHTTIWKLRLALDLDWHGEHADWWYERIEDLSDLSSPEFAAKHAVSVTVVDHHRLKLIGQVRTRPYGWWRKQEMMDIILADLPASMIARSLGLSPRSISNLQRSCRRLREQAAVEPSKD